VQLSLVIIELIRQAFMVYVIYMIDVN